MARIIPRGGQGLEEVKLMTTTVMAMSAAMVTVGWHDKEWGSNNASMTMIPLTVMKMTRTTMRQEGGWDPTPTW
jgi:hypothetical protein